jgi:hypothetical protein
VAKQYFWNHGGEDRGLYTQENIGLLFLQDEKCSKPIK